MVKNYIPERGDLVMLSFDPQAGKEQAGMRPALVISPKAYNEKVGLAICCPITTKVKGYPFETSLDSESKTKGVILTDHLKNLDWKVRKALFLEKVSRPILDEVIVKIGALIF